MHDVSILPPIYMRRMPGVPRLAVGVPENPDIENVVILNPDIENPDIENPDIENPDIENGTISDVTWTVSHQLASFAVISSPAFGANIAPPSIRKATGMTKMPTGRIAR